MTEHGDKKAIRIPRVDNNRTDLLPVAEAQVLPRFAAVDRFVKAIAGGQIGPLQAFATADINDPGIGGCDRERADRSGWLIVEDRNPCAAIVVSLPHSAIVDANIKNIRLTRNSRGAYRAPAAKWTNHAPAQVLIKAWIDLLTPYGNHTR